MFKNRRYIFYIILIIWIGFFSTDFYLAQVNKSPIFAIPITRYKDGGSTEYYGLGYKVIKYVKLTAENGMDVEDVHIGTWLMKFSPKSSVSETDLEVIEDNNKGILSDRIPMVMLDGELYIDTGRESDIDGRCGVMDGKITSTIDGSEIPKQNYQSNFGKGFEYQYVGQNSIDIFINNKWMRFEKEKDKLGLNTTTYNITSTGLTLVFNQSGGNPTGALQTGSMYWLETQVDDQWVKVEMLPSKYIIGWTHEAYMISMDDSTEFEVNWKELYGELPEGNYRIGKEVMDFRSAGVYDTYSYYGYFEIGK